MMTKSFLLSGKIARKRVGSKYQVMHRNSSRKVKAVRDVGKSPDVMGCFLSDVPSPWCGSCCCHLALMCQFVHRVSRQRGAALHFLLTLVTLSEGTGSTALGRRCSTSWAAGRWWLTDRQVDTVLAQRPSDRALTRLARKHNFPAGSSSMFKNSFKKIFHTSVFSLNGHGRESLTFWLCLKFFDQTGTQAQLPWEACSWLFLDVQE